MRQASAVELDEAVAIIGMAGRFPGAKNVDEFWDNLCNGVESVSFFSAEELQASGVDPALLEDPTFVNAGAVMDGADCFDAAFFGISPRDAEIMDPQHRLFLECAWAALEHAGYDPETYAGPIGVFGGVGPNTYFEQNLAARRELLESIGSYQAMISNGAHFPTTRVSYKLNLKGPSINVQTACSTSGVAIHLACQSVLSGECDIALAGGARIKVPLKGGYFYQADGIPSPDGHCRAFDAHAQGTVYGSGGAVIVLKRLSEALRDGDSLYAIIRASAINNDGANKVGFTAPSVQGQATAIAEAHALAGISADSVSYVEAHGTGTALGDPIEIAALTKAFRETTDKKQFCAIGSLKTNIGHLDAGAGVASVIKTALALKHRLIPPSLNFQAPNPQIDFQNSPFYVNNRLTPWPAGSTPRRAGVSSFGLGGTNVHIVLEEPPASDALPAAKPWQLLVVSAKTGAALDAATTNLANHLRRHPEINLTDVAYTLGLGRRPFNHRRVAVCENATDAAQVLGNIDPKRVVTQVCGSQEQAMVFMFPGGGAQYVNMGLELYEREAVFREQVDECLALLASHAPPDLKRILFPGASDVDTAAQRIEQPEIALPLLFTLEWAMAKLLMSWGIQPAAMIGHSMGEYTAACLAGVISLADALALVALRGRLFATLAPGSMLSVAAPETTVRALMEAELSIAAINKPSSCVVSGEVNAIEAMEQRLGQQGIDYGRVHISVAAHSQMVEPILAEFGRFAKSVTLRAPNISYVSNVTGTWITAAEATDPGYWVRHLRQTVRFSDGLSVLMRESGGVLVEVGPGQTLSTFARQHPDRATEQVVVPTFRHVQEQIADTAFLLKAVGRLWLAGVPVDWHGFYGAEQRQRLPLPTYPFERQRYWLEPSKLANDATTAPGAGLEIAADGTRESEAHYVSHVTSREEQMLMSSQAPASVTVAPARKDAIVASLKEILEQLSGIAASQMDEHATFLDMGFDSLFLTRANAAFAKKFKVKVTFRQLFRECPTLDALAAYIDSKLPPEPVAPVATQRHRAMPLPAAQAPPDRTSAAADVPLRPVGTEMSALVSDTTTTHALERIISQQLRVMSEQLETLRNVRPTTAAIHPTENTQLPGPPTVAAPTPVTTALRPAAPLPTAIGPVVADAQLAKPGPQTPANWRPPRRGGHGELTVRQRQYLEALIARYTSRTQGSKRLTQAQRGHMSDPISISGFNAHWKEMVYQIAIDHASGSRFVDVDGNEYVDLTMSFSVNLFGHSPDFVTQAVEDQLKHSVGLGMLSPLTRRVAEAMCEITGMERATFLTTGSEANMAALRAARLVSGRDKFAVFAGAYHGVFDEVLIKAVRNNGQLRAEPVAPGIPKRAVEDVVVLDYGDPRSLEFLEEYGDQLAAVFVEAVQSRHPDLQPREFLHSLREVTAQKDIALIFDEVITGFRLHPQGAQGWYGVQADMASYGKLVGGGMPMSALAGKAVYLDAFDGGAWNYGDDSFPEAGVTFFAGTFMKHPLSLAAAAAVLDHLQKSGPRLQQELNERASRFVNKLNGYFAQQRVSIWIEHCGSMLYFTFPDNNDLARLLFYALRDKGVHIWDRPLFLSTAHTDEDLAFITRAVWETVAEMKEAGILGEQSDGPVSAVGQGVPLHRNGSSPHDAEPAIGAESISVAAGTANGRANATYEVPTTESQLEIWHASQIGSDASCGYNLCYSVQLRGQLQERALQQALQLVIDRHDSLRGTFSPDGARLRIAPLRLGVHRHDCSGPDGPKQVAEVLRNEVTQPFDLVNGPLVRAHLIKLHEQHHVLVLTLHHIVCDGFSSGTVIRDLGAYYSAACRGVRAELGEAMQFSEYARLQQEEQRESEHVTAEEYWLQVYAEPPPNLELPVDRPRPPVKTYRNAEQHWVIDKTLCAGLRKMGAQHGCTLHSTLLAAYVAFLHRLTGQTDIVVATPASGQLIVGHDELVGHCVNSQPTRCRVNGEQTFTDFLSSVQALVLDTYEHRKYTFGKLLRKLKFPRDPSRWPVFSTQFNLEPDKTGLDFHGLDVDVSFNRRQYFSLDIGLNVVESGGELKIRCEYNSDLFDATTIHRWLINFQTLLQSIASNPDRAIAELPFLSPEERQQVVVEWNTTAATYPPARGLHELIAAQAERTPEAVAVTYEEQFLTYRDLNRRANQLAQRLQRLGVRPDVLVGVCLERSLDLMVALLGVLKAGGAYVPLDPDYPKDRLAFMMADAQVTVLLTQASLLAELPHGLAQVICVDRDWAEVAKEQDSAPVSGVTADNLAYMIYTSGSTGQPKGALNTHRGICNRLQWMQQTYQLSEADRVLQKTPCSFDVSVWEFFWPLMTGACVALARPRGHQDPTYLVGLIQEQGITVAHFVPSMLRTFLEEPHASSCKSLRQVICSGEALSYELQQRFFSLLETRLDNLYGPTEAAVDVTYWHCQRDDTRGLVPIGRPVANTQIYILDALLQPLPIGVAGELHIGGVQVGRGYWRRDELTAAKFIGDPFSNDPKARLYKTGDLARYLPDGTIEFLGRLDHQVKIRGNRVELEEISAALTQHPAVHDSVVVVREDKKDDPRLVAYLVPVHGLTPTASELRAFVKTRLPDYMVPSAFVTLRALPLTPSGKIDRRALPAPVRERQLTEATFVRPQSKTEQLLASMWSEILDRRAIGVHDNFFELGGHSLLAAQLIRRVRESLSVELPLRSLFAAPTIASLATAIESLLWASREQAPAMTSSDRVEIEL